MPSIVKGEGTPPYTVRKDAESRLVGLYAGKAGEVLGLASNSIQPPQKARERSTGSTPIQLTLEVSLRSVKKSGVGRGDQPTDRADPFLLENKEQTQGLRSVQQKGLPVFNLSSIGGDDMKVASKLAVSMIEEWHFYSGLLLSQNRHPLETKLSDYEYRDPDYAFFLEGVGEQLSEDMDPAGWDYLKSSFAMKGHDELRMPVWWSEEAVFPFKRHLALPTTWWRFYIPNRNENRINEQWVPSEQYYQTTSKLLNMEKTGVETTWNDLYSGGRDYLYHGLLIHSFGKALLLLENNRELLDYFAHYLVQHKILREDVIKQMVDAFCPTPLKPLVDD